MSRQRDIKGVSKFLGGAEAAQLHMAIRARWAWGQWLSGFAWTHFTTLTFRHQPSPPAAIRNFGTWVRRLEQRAQEPVHWFYAIERGAAGLVHLHALVEGTGALSADSVAAAWDHGRADVSEYEPRRGATYYLTKTAASDELECDFCIPAQPPGADARLLTPPPPPAPPSRAPKAREP